MLTLDINKEMTGGHIVHGRVGDNNSPTEKVSVIGGDGAPLNLTDVSISFMGNTKDNQTIISDSAGVKILDSTKGLFQYTFPSAAFGIAGPYERAYFLFTGKDGKIFSSGNFEILVFDNADITAEEAETVINEYNKLVAELQVLQKKNMDELKKQQSDYIRSTDTSFGAIQNNITNIQNQMTDFVSAIDTTASNFLGVVNQYVAEGRNTISNSATQAIDMVQKALDEFKKANFYTTTQADDRFAKKSDVSLAYTLKDQLQSINDANKIWEIGFYPFQNIFPPANMPNVSGLSGSGTGYLLVSNRRDSDFIVETSQMAVYPDLGRIYTRYQDGYVTKSTQNPTLKFFDWHLIAGGSPASAEEILIGDRDDVMITPKGLKQATAGSTVFEEHFGMGTALASISTDGLVLPIGASVGGSSNYVNNRPYIINSDTTLTITKKCRLKVSGNVRFVPEATNSPSDYIYTHLAVNNVYMDFASQGSTRLSDGTLKLSWAYTGTGIVDVNEGDKLWIRSSLRGGKQVYNLALMNLTIEEIRSSDNEPVYPMAKLSDNPVARQTELVQVGDWIDLILASTAEVADNAKPQYRVIVYPNGGKTRKKVEFRGAVRASATHNLPSSSSSLVVATLGTTISAPQTTIVTGATNHLSFMGRVATTNAGWLGVGNQSGTTLEYIYLNQLEYWLD